MFKLNIECSKDITELHLNFTDGTCTTIGNENDNSQRASNVTEIANDGPKHDDGDVTTKSDVKTPAEREPLTQYLEVDDLEETSKQEHITPPVIEKRERSAHVSDESKNLNL